MRAGVAITRVDCGRAARAAHAILRRTERSPLLARLGARAHRLLRKRVRRPLRRGTRDRLARHLADDPGLAVALIRSGGTAGPAVSELRGRLSFPLLVVPLLHEEDPRWRPEPLRRRLRHADRVAALTPHEARRLREAYGVPAAAVATVGAGCDAPDRPGDWPRPRRVLCLGRKSPKKGLPLLLDAMALVWGRDPSVELVVAGPGAVDGRGLERRVSALPPERRARVRWLGPVSASQKRELLGSAACLVLPGAIESFGLVVLEAWGCGTPVVAVDTPVLRCTIGHGDNGLLVPPGDADRLAAAIGVLVARPDRARAMGAAGRARALERHGWSEVVARFETLLRETVGTAAQGARA